MYLTIPLYEQLYYEHLRLVLYQDTDQRIALSQAILSLLLCIQFIYVIYDTGIYEYMQNLYMYLLKELIFVYIKKPQVWLT